MPTDDPSVPPSAPGVIVELSLPLILQILGKWVDVETTVEDCSSDNVVVDELAG